MSGNSTEPLTSDPGSQTPVPSTEPSATRGPSTPPTSEPPSTTSEAPPTTTPETPTSTSEPPTTTLETPTSSSEPPPSTTSETHPSTTSQSPPTTTPEPPTTTAHPTSHTSEPSSSSSTDVITTLITATPTTDGTRGPTTIVITSTEAVPAQPSGSSTDGASNTTGGAALPSASISNKGSSGLSTGGTIAVAVVVPVVGVALILLAALWFWRKRKATKLAEEERRKEVEEYAFNPNNDPTLPPVGMAQDDTSGYRGWGTTSIGRHPSTNPSGGAAGGMTLSDNGSAPGYNHASSPSDDTTRFSEGHERPISGETEPLGVLGAAPAASNNRNVDVHRGPSNASSAYSAANRSEASEDSHMSVARPSAQFYDDNPYYNDVQQQYGSYGEGPYGGAQPVIRDVQARRNTRIENPAVFPRQGNAGIAQNF